MRRFDEHAAARSAVLSFLLPGLGQLTSGWVRIGALFAAPAAALAIIGLAFLASDARLTLLLDPTVITLALLLSLPLLAWRAAAVVHAYAIHAPWRWGGGAVIVGVLVGLVVLTQALPSYYALRLAGTLDRISDQAGDADTELLGPMPTGTPIIDGEGAVPASPSPSPGSSPSPGPSPTDGGTPPPMAIPSPTPSPAVTPSPATDEPARLEQRVTVLLIGTDDLASREHLLTDTMLVVSLGAERRRPIMISVPRDMYGVPLPDGRVYNARLNSLLSYARARPDEFPLGGVATLRETIELVLGIEIDYVAVVDMPGLIRIVDTIGGVEVRVREEIDDPTYRWPRSDRPRGFHLEPGVHRLDGATALAFARSRHGPGGSDFVRAERQQRLLRAIRDRVEEVGLASVLPDVLDVVADNVRTDIPRERLGPFAEAVVDARWDAIDRLVLSPPRYVTPDILESGAYVLHPRLDAIRTRVDRLFTAGPE